MVAALVATVVTVAREAKVAITVVALVSPIPVAVKSSVTRKITTTPEVVVVVVVTIMGTVEAAAGTATVVSAPEAVNTVMARRTVTKSATRTPLAATVAKEAREVATVVLVARDSMVALVAREAREDTTVAFNNAPSFAKATLAGTTCIGTMNNMPSGTDVTRTLGTREDTLVEVASVVVITPVGV